MENVEDISPMQKMILDAGGDVEVLGERIAGVLEFLTVRAVVDAPFYIFTDDEQALVLVAAGDVVSDIRDALVNLTIKRWEDELSEDTDNVIPFDTNTDPGDEQDEPATESE
jgi:hypothetical protein